MKIGIMTMQRVRNYGSYLQAYGLKKLIESLGHEVVFVDYKIEPSVETLGTIKANRYYRLLKKLYRKLKTEKNKLLRPLRKEERSEFSRFIEEFEENYLRELGVPKTKQYRTRVDILVIGSDEVFNCTQGENVGFSKQLFGADSRAGKVVSYAASFGNTTLEKLEKYHIREDVRKLLNGFSALSVRDRNSYNIVKTLTGKEAELHLDPVLIYDFKDEIRDTVTEEGYIIVYAYNKRISPEEGQAIRDFAERHNKKLISISGQQPFCDKYVYCSPLQMLGYFRHADYVITDTFHGTIFSVISHRKFATLVRKDQNAQGYGNEEKLGFLLEKLGLEERRVTRLDDLTDVLEREIDYSEVDRLLHEERSRTIRYLKEQLPETIYPDGMPKRERE